MTDTRVSQVVAEVAGKGSSTSTRVSQVIAEVSYSAVTNPTATQISQVIGEVAYSTSVQDSGGGDTPGLVALNARFRMPENQVTGLSLSTNDPLTRKFLNLQSHNNSLNWEKKLDGRVRNINGDPNDSGRQNPRRHIHKAYLQNDLVIWTDSVSYAFGPPDVVGADNRPSWKSFIYNFPTNGNGDYFNSEYQPVAVVQLLNAVSLSTGGPDYPKLTLTLIRVATNYLKFDIHQLEDGHILSQNDRFWVSIFVIGRKGNYWPEIDTMLTAPNNLEGIPPTIGKQVY